MPRVFRTTSFLALLLCALVVASCGDDPFAVRAPFQTVTDSFSIRALTGTSGSARALWRIGTFRRYRLDSIGSQFDLGFDLDATGRIIVYPARSIAVPPPGTLAAPPLVALLASTAAYATADRAPETGYVTDSALVITKGQTVFVRSASDFCASQNTGGTLLFAKFIVDSVNPVTRELLVRTTIQPSCNFRSFATGVPTF
ncbi:MAG: hypothetical protein U5K74_06500 [Gemmatimonadaceae bacterium]|nr:hypothetical protein [Gemmatimonadaceae bacterium]